MMKKSVKRTIFLSPFVIVCAIACAIIASAQNKILQIHKDGKVIESINISDIDSITFSDFNVVENMEVVINGVTWAACNVGDAGTFVSSPEQIGKYYQWNRKKSWDVDAADGWDSSMPSENTWLPENSPCPSGWRLPTKKEIQSLIDAGSKWVEMNGVLGRRFGEGDNSIFIPGAGALNNENGELKLYGEYFAYWTSSKYNTDNMCVLLGGKGDASINIMEKNWGLPIRCVKEESKPEIIEVSSIQIYPQQISLKIGESYRLSASVLPANASDQTVSWKSFDSSIVSVDENGLVVALNEGEGLIGAYAGGKYATCTVNVYNKDSYDEGVIINGIKWATRNVGSPGKFSENPEAPGMLYQWNNNVAWGPADKSISIPEGGEWIDVEIGTEEYIDYHWESYKNPCPTGWRVPTISELESLISSGYKEETRNGLNGLVFGSGSNTIFIPYVGSINRSLDKNYGFGSSSNYWSDTPNPNVKGYVFGLSAPNKTTPKVRTTGYASIYDAMSIRCVADEYIPVSSIEINKKQLSMTLGNCEQLSATVFPENASNRQVVWSSSDASVASVNGNTGSVFARGPGNATITARVDDKTAACDVRVSGTLQTGLSLNKSQLKLKPGETYNLVAKITPPDATFNTVTWTSQDPSIATVDQNGKVKASKFGSTYIYAATKSMSTSCKVTVDNKGGDGGGSSEGSGNITGQSFSSAQLYYYGNMSSNTTYFRLSLFNMNDLNGLVIEGFCDKAYTYDNFILAPGVYKFSSVYGTPKTFIEGEFFGDPSDNGRYMGTYYYTPAGCVLFNGGTISVSKSGDSYTISTNLSGYSNSSSSTYKNLNFTFSGVPKKINFFK